MAKRKNEMDRRDFFKTGAGTAVAGVLGLGGNGRAEGETLPTSRVVLVRRENAVDAEGNLNDEVLPAMLDDAVRALYETDDASKAWRKVVDPDDVVGVKSNEWGRLPTPAALEHAIVERVTEIGVDRADVAVDDRGVRHDPVFQRATVLINIRPLRTHHWSGLGTCLKNLISFVPRPSDYHGDTCAPLGAIWHLPKLEGKVRLNVLVMLTPQFHGIGPHSFSKKFVWPYAGLIVSTDPVAADATGARIIEAKRREFFGDERPISPSPHHIQIAETQYGLGVSDPDRIELIRLGWQQDALI